VRRALTRTAVVGTFLRSFVIQGSWNYHTMLGTGFAWAMLPGLRRIFRDDPKGFENAVLRHLEHFNAHPYLAGVALGAALRLEADGADPEVVRRFKSAVRGPLGALGDTLVWAAWLPGVAVAALALYWLGVPAVWAAASFLLLYNVGHIALRAWGLRAGLASGRDVASRLTRADLAGWARRLEPAGVFLIGLLAGALLTAPTGFREAGVVWIVLGGAAFVVGLLGGHRTWRPAAVLTVTAVAAIAAAGILS
jgi:PTS system mannose-specific IID component